MWLFWRPSASPQSPTRYEFGDPDIVKVLLLGRDPRSAGLDGPAKEPLADPPRTAAALGRDDVAAATHPSVVPLLDALEQRSSPQRPGLFWMIDGKPLPIGGCSKDRQAGYGRAAIARPRATRSTPSSIPRVAADWRMAPMNKDERVMAERMVGWRLDRGLPVGDTNYDSNRCTRSASARQVAIGHARRHGANHRNRSQKADSRSPSFDPTDRIPLPGIRGPTAARSIQHRTPFRFPMPPTGAADLTCLPPWVRTHRRVHRWVQAKLVLTALKNVHAGSRTYAA